MSKVVRIPSRLYSDLSERGGDRLIATYCMLKNSKKGKGFKNFKSANNKKVEGFNLLRLKTSLSIKSIQKYCPILIEMGLIFIDDTGVYFKGNNKLKDIYKAPETRVHSKTGKVYKNPKAGQVKLVPILIGKNITDTAHNVMSVRLFSAMHKQERQVDVKKKQSDVLKHKSNPSNMKLYRKARNLSKKLIEKNGTDKISFTEKNLLSNQGYAKLKDNTENNKSKGTYWKKVLKKKGLVETSRRFSPIRKISVNDYICYKNSGMKSKNETYYNGWLVEEKTSTFSPINIIGSKTKYNSTKN